MVSYRRSLFILIIFLVSLSFSPDSVAQGPQPDPRFGIVEAYLNSQAATEAGAGYTRIIFRWDQIQPGGRDDWKPANVPDPYIEAELQAGREIAAVLIGTPAWAARIGQGPQAVPDLEAWGNFTKRMAQQYQGRIKHWIIWNQPDVWDAAHPGYTWQGSEVDYLELLKSAYSNIKVVDPAMEVHLAGLTYHWDAQHGREQFLSRLLALIAADPEAARYNYYFDAVSYHLYYNPLEMLNILGQIHSMLDTYRLGDKPIWVNEINAPPTDDPQEPPLGDPPLAVSGQEQAAFVIQAYALLIAGGADRVAFFKMRNSADHPESAAPTGLLRADDSRRAAFDAYRIVTGHFSGYEDYSWYQQDSIIVVTLDRGNQTTTVLWNTATQEAPFALNAIASQARLIDETGAEQTIAASNGSYKLTLPAATCSAGWCFIGGAPRVLVEAGSPDQRASLIPLATNTPTVTPLPTDTSSPTSTPTITPTPTATPLTQSAAPAPQNTPIAIAAAESIPNSALQPETKVTPIPNTNLLQPPTLNPQSPIPNPQPPTLNPQPPTPNPQSPIPNPLTAILTPDRVVILVVLGLILFTFFYFVQFRVWNSIKRG
jgi:hypothetical protein